MPAIPPAAAASPIMRAEPEPGPQFLHLRVSRRLDRGLTDRPSERVALDHVLLAPKQPLARGGTFLVIGQVPTLARTVTAGVDGFDA